MCFEQELGHMSSGESCCDRVTAHLCKRASMKFMSIPKCLSSPCEVFTYHLHEQMQTVNLLKCFTGSETVRLLKFLE